MGEGRKYDDDKPRWDLLPMSVVEEVVGVLTHGAKKYAPDNWRKVEDGKDRYYAAAMRHLSAWRQGQDFDESGFSHLAHAICSLIFVAALENY